MCLYIHAMPAMQLQNHNSTEVDMSGGSSSAKGFGHGSGKGGRKGPPIVWDNGPTIAAGVERVAEKSGQNVRMARTSSADDD